MRGRVVGIIVRAGVVLILEDPARAARQPAEDDGGCAAAAPPEEAPLLDAPGEVRRNEEEANQAHAPGSPDGELSAQNLGM